MTLDDGWTFGRGRPQRNIEMKLELRDAGLARSICVTIGALFVSLLEQTDTYFNIPDGRLKRREARGWPVEYVFYHRSDSVSPRASHFVVYEEAAARERFGATDPPVWVVVKKRRELYVLPDLRIHLDEVEGLGRFIEFEALVTNRRSSEEGEALVAELRRQFGPALGEPVAVSYSDLVAAEQTSRSAGDDASRP